MSIPQQGGRTGLDLVPVTGDKATKKDYTSDQEVRWCPGCGDYAILAAVQGFMPQLGLRKENVVFISGIGCAARFLVDAMSYTSVRGLPFKAAELSEAIREVLSS